MGLGSFCTPEFQVRGSDGQRKLLNVWGNIAASGIVGIKGSGAATQRKVGCEAATISSLTQPRNSAKESSEFRLRRLDLAV
jgi:hypothetical protein